MYVASSDAVAVAAAVSAAADGASFSVNPKPVLYILFLLYYLASHLLFHKLSSPPLSIRYHPIYTHHIHVSTHQPAHSSSQPEPLRLSFCLSIDSDGYPLRNRTAQEKTRHFVAGFRSSEDRADQAASGKRSKSDHRRDVTRTAAFVPFLLLILCKQPSKYGVH
jgi:hypothetical protein